MSSFWTQTVNKTLSWKTSGNTDLKSKALQDLDKSDYETTFAGPL